MLLQRPAVSDVRCWHARWAVTLRIAPGRGSWYVGTPVENDNDWARLDRWRLMQGYWLSCQIF